jgi:hypothetical protein
VKDKLAKSLQNKLDNLNKKYSERDLMTDTLTDQLITVQSWVSYKEV